MSSTGSEPVRFQSTATVSRVLVEPSHVPLVRPMAGRIPHGVDDGATTKLGAKFAGAEFPF